MIVGIFLDHVFVFRKQVILAAFLAGVNRMPWRGFLLANAGGAVIWAAVFGVGGYIFGKVLLQLHGAVGPIAFVLATAVLLGGGFLMRRFEIRLSEAGIIGKIFDKSVATPPRTPRP